MTALGCILLKSSTNNKKQIRTNFDLRNSSDLFRLVDPRRIELLSEKRSAGLSPSAFCHLKFPSRSAGKQALHIGSFLMHDGVKS